MAPQRGHHGDFRSAARSAFERWRAAQAFVMAGAATFGRKYPPATVRVTGTFEELLCPDITHDVAHLARPQVYCGIWKTNSVVPCMGRNIGKRFARKPPS